MISEELPLQRSCGATAAYFRLLEIDPDFQQRQTDLELFTAQAKMLGGARSKVATVKIPAKIGLAKKAVIMPQITARMQTVAFRQSSFLPSRFTSRLSSFNFGKNRLGRKPLIISTNLSELAKKTLPVCNETFFIGVEGFVVSQKTFKPLI